MTDPTKPGRGTETTTVVYHDPTRERGAPVEPEQQAAEVVQPIETFVTIGRSHLARDIPMHTLPQAVQEAAMVAKTHAHIAHQTTAGELAQSVAARCMNCVHFDHDWWMRIKRDAEDSGDKDRLFDLNIARGMLGTTGNAKVHEMHDDGSGDIDLEHALNSLGICKALTDHFKDHVITHPLSSCPADAPFAFKAKRSLAERRAVANAYDWILQSAQRGGPRP
jgi:hypothetical protein